VSRSATATATAIVVVGLVVAGRLWIASRWDPIADEAYHWTWSLAPALGYYDQPPLVAWALAGAELALGHHALGLRIPAIAGWAIAVLALTPSARERELWWWWALGLPPLAVLTLLAVPDGLLLPLWALGLAAAIRGGRGWWLAGLCGGLASLAKYTGIGLVPLLIAGALPGERRTRDPWIGLGLAQALLAPNLWWNLGHGWVTFRFQAGEGLWSPRPPLLGGVLRQLVDQALALGPLAFGAAAAWMGRGAWRWRELDRVDRLCLAVSAPIALGFALAALGGPPEAHWPAPAWIGAGLGLARAAPDGRIARAGHLGAVLAAFGTLALFVHSVLPLAPLARDPAVRLTEGALLARDVARWVEPAATEDARALPVYTERYQEAALIAWHTGLTTRTVPGCGRRSQYDIDDEDGRGAPLADEAWFVRPSRGRPPGCVARWLDVEGPHAIRPIDDEGRPVGPWDLYRLAGNAP